MTALYNLRKLAEDHYMVAKFDADFNVLATYELHAKGFSYTCDCPANSKAVITRPCRHKLMMPTLLPACDTERFYNFDTQEFSEPLGDLLTAEEIEAMPDGAEKDLQHALQDEIEAGEASHRVGEAPPSPLSMPDAIVGEQMIDLKTAPPAPQPPTIRRR